jgi:hypothetical protein
LAASYCGKIYVLFITLAKGILGTFFDGCKLIVDYGNYLLVGIETPRRGRKTTGRGTTPAIDEQKDQSPDGAAEVLPS